MNEEELNELVKEHYGFTIDEIDENVGDLSLRVSQLEYNNKKLQQENQELKKSKHKAIDKLICWGEILDPIFQKEMLDILEDK